jgi:hypothetical protein
MQSATGSGLGLALVKELTEAMGGSVSVESILAEGSCFTIAVPRATDPTPSASTERRRKPPPSTLARKARVMPGEYANRD